MFLAVAKCHVSLLRHEEANTCKRTSRLRHLTQPFAHNTKCLFCWILSALSPRSNPRLARALWLYSVICTHLAVARLSLFFSRERVVALLLRVAAFVPPHPRAHALAVRELIDRVLSVRLCRKSYLVRILGLTERDPCRARLSTAAGDRARPLPSGGNRLRITRKEPPTPTTLARSTKKHRTIFDAFTTHAIATS